MVETADLEVLLAVLEARETSVQRAEVAASS